MMKLVTEKNMRIQTAVLAAVFCAVPVFADSPKPVPITPEQFQWISPPQIPGAQISWVVGAEKAPVPYVFRVQLAKGTKVQPHTHPDERITAVLSGTLYVGFGDSFSEADLVAVPAGAVYIAPANMPHFIWAKDGMVSYQENGMGPTGTLPIKR